MPTLSRRTGFQPLHPTARDSRAATQARRDDPPPVDAPKKPTREEPAVDAEPLSSSDELQSNTSRGSSVARGPPVTLKRPVADCSSGPDQTVFWRAGKKARTARTFGKKLYTNIHTLPEADGENGEDELASAPAKPAFKMPDTAKATAILNKVKKASNSSESSASSSSANGWKDPPTAPPKKKRNKSTDSQGSSFKQPPDNPLTSESAVASRPAFKVPQDLPKPSEDASPDDNLLLRDKALTVKQGTKPGLRNPPRRVLATQSANKRERKPRRAPVEFRPPPGLDINEPTLPLLPSTVSRHGPIDLGDDDSPLSSISSDTDPPGSPTFSARPPSSSATSAGPAVAAPPLHGRCPLCSEPFSAAVRRSLVAEFPCLQGLSLRQQGRLHVAHLAAAAHALARERRYPAPDWAGLRRRLDLHHAALAAALIAPPDAAAGASGEGGSSGGGKVARPVPLRREFGAIVGGRADVQPHGYYGDRGARAIEDWLMTRFGTALAARAAGDQRDGRIGAKGGVPLFVQSVLVPPIVRALVVQDLRGNREMREAARQRRGKGAEGGAGSGDDADDDQLASMVLRESAELGRYTGEEQDDHVEPRDEDDDTG